MAKQNQPHAVCGAKTRSGSACKTRPMPNGRCRMHGGTSTGPLDQSGNQNARRHGLFSKALGESGLKVYEAAKDLTVDQLARDTAEFVVAKVAETYEAAQDAEGVYPLVEVFLSQLVADEKLSPKQMSRILSLLAGPDIAALGKALGPLKGLLETKRGENVDPTADARTVKIEMPPGRSL